MDFGKGLSIDIHKSLKIQENNIISHNKDTYLTNNMAKFLAKKSKKKEEDLLIYKSDSFRLKRELDNIIENKQNMFERYGNHSW